MAEPPRTNRRRTDRFHKSQGIALALFIFDVVLAVGPGIGQSSVLRVGPGIEIR
jgi:hypothetical protein